MYQIITPSGPAAWTGSLHECLYILAHQLSKHNFGITAHTVTVAQAMAAGYSIQKKEAV